MSDKMTAQETNKMIGLRLAKLVKDKKRCKCRVYKTINGVKIKRGSK